MYHFFLLQTLSEQIASDPQQFSKNVLLCGDGIHIVDKIIWWKDKCLGSIQGLLDMDRAKDLHQSDMANEIFTVICSSADGHLFLPVAHYPVRGLTTARLFEIYYEVELALKTVCVESSEIDMNFI
jgi:hypothetical protein